MPSNKKLFRGDAASVSLADNNNGDGIGCRAHRK